MENTVEFQARFNKLIATWSNAYRITLRTRKAKETRYNELMTWDKPRKDNKHEHDAKCIALENLLR